ncbi:MAG: TrkH family potassium uptake protein [Chloroflexi bacterium]|nr:TrkH family potassium uptake protein [Chloroflexota bacterium]
MLLSLPLANREGVPTPYIAAIFTATSAVCVTGLVVVDTYTYWSPFGQAVILGLIQVGGLGFMTASTFLFLLLGRRVTLTERLLLRASHGVSPLGGVINLTRQVVRVTLVIEGIGAAILAARLAVDYDLPRALWMGVFHSVSAFNNAGFDLFGEFRSLTIYNRDPIILLTIAFLIILGGISFTVLLNVSQQQRYRYLLLDTKLVLLGTGALLVVGTFGLLLFENGNPNTMGPLDLPAKALNAFFSAVTPRTAGYNSIDVGKMTEAGLFLTVALMYIGAAAGSTGGGIKVNTFAALAAVVLAGARGREKVTAFGNEIPPSEINRALTVALMALGLVFVVTMVLTLTEPFRLLQVLFEATSAFGTVGLSTGITPHLSLAGKLIIIGTMYIGRVGPLTMALALAQRTRPQHASFPPAQLKIG